MLSTIWTVRPTVGRDGNPSYSLSAVSEAGQEKPSFFLLNVSSDPEQAENLAALFNRTQPYPEHFTEVLADVLG